MTAQRTQWLHGRIFALRGEIAFVLGLLLTVVLSSPLNAGLLDSLKDRAKEEAHERAEEAARAKEEEAKAKAEQAITDAAEKPAEAQPEKPTTAESPATGESPSAEAATSVDSGAAVSSASLPSSLTPAALPPASQFSIALCTEVAESNEHEPLNAGSEFSCYAPKLIAVVVNQAKTQYAIWARVFRDDGGQASGPKVPVTAASPVWNEFSPEAPRMLLEMPFPEVGLPAGKYHMDLVEAAEPNRVIATVPFTLRVPPPPPADAFDLTLSTTLTSDTDSVPVDPKTEFSTWPDKLIVTVTSKTEPLTFSARIAVDEVEGLKSGTILGGVPTDTARVEEGARSNHLDLILPNFGLPAGKYRVEVVEANPPFRVIKSQPFTTRTPNTEATESLNLADSRYGGLIEWISREDGAGLTWASVLLTPGNAEPWSPYVPLAPDGSAVAGEHALPCEMVLSFYQHESALVSSVEFVSADADHALRSVEIWGSKDNSKDSYTRLAVGKNESETEPTLLKVTVPPTELRFLKFRFLETADAAGELKLSQIHVLEGSQAGYQPLAKRLPAVSNWALQPRHAAQTGLFYLQSKSVAWQKTVNCLGCHVQAQSLMGIDIARKNDYVVSGAAEKTMADFIVSQQSESGSFEGPSRSIFASFGLAHSHRSPDTNANLSRAATALAGLQSEEGAVPGDGGRPPIEQGEIMYTHNSILVWSEALAFNPDSNLEAAKKRGIEFIAKADAATTQDKVFKILTLAQWGSPEQKKLARKLCVELQSEQLKDGGWMLEADDPKGPTAYATGQVLYALRVAGIRPTSPSFQKGVEFLIARQNRDGSWRDPQLSSPFAATMWPVIAMTGTFGRREEPAHIIVSAQPRHPAPTPPPIVTATAPVVAAVKTELPKNLELILDCSFSMNDRLGKTTRIATAKTVMRDLINRLPANLNVGLRFYGHRFDSMSRESSKDTELVFPIQPLNRAAMIKLIDGVSANGQTPLVYSTLQAAEDLKKIGGGAIVLVTDGEESCGGKPRKAGPQIAAMGVPIRLDIIGFTLTGKRVTDELIAFTTPTGGHFSTAADAVQLAAALTESTSPAPRPAAPVVAAIVTAPAAEPKVEDFAYEIFNDANEKVAATTTLSGDTPDLEPGVYRVVLHDGSKEFAVVGVKLGASAVVELKYQPDTGKLERVAP